MKTDIEIAQEAEMLPIKEVAQRVGLQEDDLELYGKYKAKISNEYYESIKDNEDGKLILVTAIKVPEHILIYFSLHNKSKNNRNQQQYKIGRASCRERVSYEV